MKRLHLLGLSCLLASAGFSPLFAQAPSFDRPGYEFNDYLLGLSYWKLAKISLSSPSFGTEAYDSLEFTVENLPSGLSLEKSDTEAALIIVGVPTELGEFDVNLTASNEHGSASLYLFEITIYPTAPEMSQWWAPDYPGPDSAQQGTKLPPMEVAHGPWEHYSSGAEWLVEGLPEGIQYDVDTYGWYLRFDGLLKTAGEYPIKITLSTEHGSNTQDRILIVHSSKPQLRYDGTSETIDPIWSSVGQNFELYIINNVDIGGILGTKPTWEVGELPDGLSFTLTPNEDNYRLGITGMLNHRGHYTIQVSAKNYFGEASTQFEIYVDVQRPNIDGGSQSFGYTLGDEISFSISIDKNGLDTEVSVEGLDESLSMEIIDVDDDQMYVQVSGSADELFSNAFTVIAENSIGTDTSHNTIIVSRVIERPVDRRNSIFSVGYARFGEFAYSDWLGFVFDANFPWIYNFEQGWLYVWEGTTSQDSVWFYHYGPPSKGWMYSGRDLDGFFYYETEPGVWSWQWLYTGTFDPDAPDGGPPANP